MARISTYAVDTSISSLDTLVGSDAEDSNITKNFKIGDLAAFISSTPAGSAYTSLVQLLTQDGTNPPVAIEVYNDTNATFTWSYVSTGVYRITSATSLFTANKTIISASKTVKYAETVVNRISDTVIELSTYQENRLLETAFEVKIYN